MPTKLRRALPHQLILGAAAFVAIIPLLLVGSSCGHDFDFHLLSWLEAAKQFAHLQYPQWAFTPAYNAGEPRFLFYPPLSWMLGASLAAVLPWKFVPIVFTWIALTLSGLTMHRLASRYASPNATLLAATLYLANPYMLFTAYERTAYGELLAAAWLPLLVAAAFATRVRILPIAIPLALIWLTNAPAAVIASYALAFLTLIRLCTRSSTPRLRLALTVAAGTALAFALAAFYILPAAYEQRFVQVDMAVADGMRPVDHFLFHRMPGGTNDYHDAVVRAASIVAILLLAAIAASLLAAYKKNCLPSRSGGPAFSSAEASSLLLPLLLLTLLIAFLLTPPSLFLWNHIPKLAFLQFPWRLSSLLGLILSLATALALNRRLSALPSSLLPLPCLILVTALVLPAWHFFNQPCDDEDAIPARVALFHTNLGTDATDEYTPTGADSDFLKPKDPTWWLIPAGASIDTAAPPNSTAGSSPAHLTFMLPAPTDLVLKLREYPHWQIRLNGNPIAPVSPPRNDGLITVPLPPGADTIDIRWVRTPDQTLGLAISALAAVLTLALARKKLSADS